MLHKLASTINMLVVIGFKLYAYIDIANIYHLATTIEIISILAIYFMTVGSLVLDS